MNVTLPRFTKWLIRILATLLGLYFGYLLNLAMIRIPALQFQPPYRELLAVGCMIVCGIILFALSVPLVRGILRLAGSLESHFVRGNSVELVSGAIGLICGLLVAFLLQPLFAFELVWLRLILMLVLYIVLAVIGIRFGRAYIGEFIISRLKLKPSEGNTLILDTSAIIDGRIVEVARTGFLPANYIVPSFVLDELSRIADSEDLLKRNRGRRGLDMLKQLQKFLPVEILERDYGSMEPDAKLLKLAEELKAGIVTVDQALVKLGGVKKIKVLNLNELSNAIKPDALPGEELTVKIVKAGNQRGQGVAFKEDGTLIVVENGEPFVGQTVRATVTTSLQGANGRIIFCKIL